MISICTIWPRAWLNHMYILSKKKYNKTSKIHFILYLFVFVSFTSTSSRRRAEDY